MSDLQPSLEAVAAHVAAFERELSAAPSLNDAKSLRDRYLGRKNSIVAAWMQLIGSAPVDQKKHIGQYANHPGYADTDAVGLVSTPVEQHQRRNVRSQCQPDSLPRQPVEQQRNHQAGSNEGAEKIEMTAPVLIDTANDRKRMSFIMPKKAVAKGVPKPAGDKVTLGKVKAATFAVLHFGGARTAENEKGAIEKLQAWLALQKIVGKGDPLLACYDPPWTPVFMRRNEVMIRIVKHHD